MHNRLWKTTELLSTLKILFSSSRFYPPLLSRHCRNKNYRSQEIPSNEVPIQSADATKIKTVLFILKQRKEFLCFGGILLNELFSFLNLTSRLPDDNNFDYKGRS